MHHLHVACAIIERDGLVLAAQRSASMRKLPLKWEFPGGKIDPGETVEECLHRELFEEIGISVWIRYAMQPHTHNYPGYSVTLYPFICTVASGEVVMNEHAALCWLPPEKLHTLDWAEADFPVIESYLASLRALPHKP